ncbi:hypothetical protein E2C01_014393 [Portunus trituberculatus]|uniref:Uncharacterized protein n=1 Tax=Portunus trituberculatus TaxID=210409 RepID=A0A5B7DJW4_PORTR|nr:hypothetical protein [Portunus trituberculatus]
MCVWASQAIRTPPKNGNLDHVVGRILTWTLQIQKTEGETKKMDESHCYSIKLTWSPVPTGAGKPPTFGQSLPTITEAGKPSTPNYCCLAMTDPEHGTTNTWQAPTPS